MFLFIMTDILVGNQNGLYHEYELLILFIEINPFVHVQRYLLLLDYIIQIFYFYLS